MLIKIANFLSVFSSIIITRCYLIIYTILSCTARPVMSKGPCLLQAKQFNHYFNFETLLQQLRYILDYRNKKQIYLYHLLYIRIAQICIMTLERLLVYP